MRTPFYEILKNNDQHFFKIKRKKGRILFFDRGIAPKCPAVITPLVTSEIKKISLIKNNHTFLPFSVTLHRNYSYLLNFE